MKVAIVGRTAGLLRCARQVIAAGHEIPLVITSKEAPEYSVTADDFRDFAADIGAHFIRTAQIQNAIAAIRSAGPCDIAVSVNFAGVIAQEVIDCFPLGILNGHGGELPRYRGNACQAWAIINGERQIGLCIHRMVGGELDSGDIVAEEQLAIDPTTKVGEVLAWMEDRVPDLFLDALEALSANADYVLRRQSRDPADALRCYPRRPEDGLIDWRLPALDIVRLIKASGKPFAGAFTFVAGERITIWDAAIVDDGGPFLAVPGQVTSVSPLQVATGSGIIALLDWGGGDIRSIRQRLG